MPTALKEKRGWGREGGRRRRAGVTVDSGVRGSRTGFTIELDRKTEW